MDDRIRRALSRGHLIDITTTGRKTGQPRRVELVFHNFDGRIYLAGLPSRRKRAWLANLEANPRFTFHLKGAVSAELPAIARPIIGDAERRDVFAKVAHAWPRTDPETLVAFSPLVEVTILEQPARPETLVAGARA